MKSGFDAFWSNIFSGSGKVNDTTRVDILQKIPIFGDLTRRELRTISDMVYDRSYEEGEYMFETGQPGAAMFVIESGEVMITRKNSEGEEVHLARLKNGEFLGELALLDSSPRSASAYVNKPTSAMAIFREDLDKLLDTNPELGGKVMKRLAVIIGMRLKATNDLLMTKDEEINDSKK